METKFNVNRTWGVEIEFFGVDRYELAAKIRMKGVDCQVVGYTHDIMNCWKITTDGSVNVRGEGFEMVSQVLKGDEGFRQLKIVCDTMTELKCKVDKTCGLHVHQDAHDFTKNDFSKLFGLYYRFEGTIDSMMPESRRGNNNHYCKSIRSMSIGLLKNKSFNRIAELYHSDRYHKLNTQSYIKYGTIEFRQHSGTVEFEKISNWIMFTNIMMDRAKNFQVRMVYEAKFDTFGALKAAFNLLSSKGADEQVCNMVKYFETRIKKLSKNNGEEVAA